MKLLHIHRPFEGRGVQLRLASQCSPRYRFSSFVRLFSQVPPSHFYAPFHPASRSQGGVTKPIAISHAPPTAPRRPGSQRSRLRSHRFHDRMTGPRTHHPPPPGGRRALYRVDAAPPLLAVTRSARLAPGSGSFAGTRLLLAVDRRSRLCPSRRAPRRARATSGAVSLRSTAPPADFAGRSGVLAIGDRSPTSPGSLAGPVPAYRAGLSSIERGGGSRSEPAWGRAPPPPGIPGSSGAGASRNLDGE